MKPVASLDPLAMRPCPPLPQPRGCEECDVLCHASPVSIPAPVGSALTLCIMCRTVHYCLCVSDTQACCVTCSGCHCLRVSADTPQDHKFEWLRMHVSGFTAPRVCSGLVALTESNVGVPVIT